MKTRSNSKVLNVDIPDLEGFVLCQIKGSSELCSIHLDDLCPETQNDHAVIRDRVAELGRMREGVLDDTESITQKEWHADEN